MIKKTGTKKKKTILDFNRNQIGSVDLSNLKDVFKMTEGERKNYLQDAEALWMNPVFKNEVLYIMQKQLEFMGMEALTWEQVLISRGVINGIDLFRERIEVFHNQHLQAIKPADKFDKFQIYPED